MDDPWERSDRPAFRHSKATAKYQQQWSKQFNHTGPPRPSLCADDSENSSTRGVPTLHAKQATVRLASAINLPFVDATFQARHLNSPVYDGSVLERQKACPPPPRARASRRGLLIILVVWVACTTVLLFAWYTSCSYVEWECPLLSGQEVFVRINVYFHRMFQVVVYEFIRVSMMDAWRSIMDSGFILVTGIFLGLLFGFLF